MKPKKLSELSLYVHIPFCTSRCRYCNFYFEVGWSPRILKDCLNKILEESSHYAQLLGQPRIKTIYFGGGTPSIIPPEDLDLFLKEFKRIWLVQNDINIKPLEWSFEANPESLSSDLLSLLEEQGIDRISLGIQSSNDSLLSFLGRRAFSEEIHRALSLLAKKWKGRWSVDFIAGIPGQSKDHIDTDLKLINHYGIDHVSLYGLTVEERTPLEQWIGSGSIKMDSQEAQDQLWIYFAQGLEKEGLLNYEVSNFAKPGHESKHNRSYWSLAPYLGLGPGAVSLLPADSFKATGVPAFHQRNQCLFEYGPPHHPLNPEQEALSPEKLALEALITGLRTSTGLDLNEFQQSFGYDLAGLWETSTKNLSWIDEENKLNSTESSYLNSGRLTLSFKTRLMLNSILKSLASTDFTQFKRGEPRWPKVTIEHSGHQV